MFPETLSDVAIFFSGQNERLASEYSKKIAVWLRTVILWRERSKQRRALLELDDRLLRDIGVTKPQAIAEARKPFWNP